MPTDRLRAWLITLSLTLIGGVARFWDLGYPTDRGTPVFDEKHYVPQAWQVLRNGGVEDNPGYGLVVHPPLGKQLIAIGEALFGYNGCGWRVASAVAGMLCVLLIIRITRRLTRSTLLGGIAGVLLICDGVSHVQARMGMLDIFQAVFVLAAFGALIVDRDDVRARLARAAAEGRIGDSQYGPRLGVRWWRFGAGVLIGLACGVKWSGLYWLIAFGVLCLIWDATARRSAGVRRPWVGTCAATSARPCGRWSRSRCSSTSRPGGPGSPARRPSTATRSGSGSAQSGPFSFVPDALRSLWYYSGHVLDFHSHLLTPVDHPHPWESKPWTWPMGLRPMLYYYGSGAEAPGCGTEDCVAAVMLIGTPALWWVSLPVLVWALWRASAGSTGATGRCSSATAPACCRGSSTSTARCTTST